MGLEEVEQEQNEAKDTRRALEFDARGTAEEPPGRKLERSEVGKAHGVAGYWLS